MLMNYGKHISVAELFPSSIKFCQYIESIKGKVSIVSEEQYSELSVSLPNCYFTRSNYVEDKELLEPSPHEWKRICSCNSPCNPDLQYAQCGKCEEWFHVECITNFKE